MEVHMDELIGKIYETLGGNPSQDDLLALWDEVVAARKEGYKAAVEEYGRYKAWRVFELKNAKLFHLMDLIEVRLDKPGRGA
jgi:hypothetical protein